MAAFWGGLFLFGGESDIRQVATGWGSFSRALLDLITLEGCDLSNRRDLIARRVREVVGFV